MTTSVATSVRWLRRRPRVTIAGPPGVASTEELGDFGELGGLGELGDLLGGRDRSRSAPDPRASSAYPPKKRSSFFKDLLEGFGE